jgi:hypothetical protein
MSKLYNFYAKLDRLEFEFTHNSNVWYMFKPKEKYTLGKQSSLLLDYSVILFFKFSIKINKIISMISDKLAIKEEIK